MIKTREQVSQKQEPGGSLGKGKRVFAFAGLFAVLISTGVAGLDILVPVGAGSSANPIDSAILKTDTEADRLFSKAGEFVEGGRFDLAAVLWQKVLDDYGDNLITREEWKMETLDNAYRKYLTVREDLESRLPNLDARALASYRLSADAEAKSLMAGSTGDPAKRSEALAEVVRRYFLSSVGDDAAYELGCLKMERHEFFPALYYFRRILDSHPDPSISKAEIQIRVAVARAFVGDAGRAAETMEKVKADIGPVDPSSVRAVDVKIAEAAAAAGGASGEVKPEGVPALPDGMMSTDLSEDWVQPFELDLGELAELFQNRPTGTGKNKMSREQLLQIWRNGSMLPTGKTLIDGDRLYFKNANRLVCVNAATGKVQWLGHPNDFAFDKQSAQTGQQQQQISLFKDRVHQSMAIRGDKIFTLQGRPQDIGGNPTVQNVRRSGQQFPGRHRNNWLAAYNKIDGRLRWYRQAKEKGDKVEELAVEACFIGEPTFYESLMLIPILQDGAIHLAALNPVDGKTIWTSFLCQEPMGAVRTECPVKIMVDAGEAYVATGSGVVFALDALSGSVRWCVRYPRSGKSQARRNYYQAATISGWSEDHVVVWGDQLVVLGSDMDYVFSLNRSDGGIAWESARNPFGDSTAGTYVIGEAGGKMFVGGSRVIRCYDIRGGRLLWQTELEETSFGRGAMAGDAIYLPVDRSIVRINMSNGKKLAEAAFTSPTPEPIGNLVTDGKRLYGFGLERVYAFGGLEQRFETLSKQIASGDAEAFRTRMRLYNQTGNPAKALEDLKGHFAFLVKQGKPVAAGEVAYDGIAELSILDESPAAAIGWVQREAEATAGVTPEEKEGIQLRRDGILSAVFSKIERQGAKVPITDVIKAAALCGEQYLIYGGRRAAAKVAKDEDIPELKRILREGAPMERIFAASALRVRAGKGALADLKGSLDTAKDPSAKLYLATDLINLGERAGLATLAELLGQEDKAVRRSAVARLRYVSGQSFPYDANAADEELAKGVTAWKTWAGGDGMTAELSLPVGERPPYRGHTLAVVRERGTYVVQELDTENKVVRRTEFKNQIYGLQKLPNGNMLLSFNDGVREYSATGEKVWDLGRPPSGYSVARRLANGNTAVGYYGGNLAEYTPDGAVAKVWRKELGSYSPIEITEEDSILIADYQNQRVMEVVRDGATPWELKLSHNVYWASRGADGTTVVALGDQNRVEAYSRDKKLLWTVPSLSYPRYAQSLPNGNTVILHQQGIVEVDSRGKVIKRSTTRYEQIYRF